ncbi:hypothetical protein [uncultured Aquimarina sp.]|uniref:hypothetical protein n=1 Tax=uncultured Aquimarina sp. TaxID=575652 RepID=UPI00261CC2B8|nr:hypothetical protein [uncultured Aquimarina sp.]
MKTYLKDIIKEKQFDGIISNVNEVTAYFKDLSPDSNSFISIINNNNNVLRFTWVAEQKWLVEYPVVTNQIHQQRYANESESLVLINRVNDNESFDNFSGFTEVPVGEFTLDEILEFKEEDAYLLREEEPPTKKVVTPKSTSTVSKSKKTSKSSLIFGDITIPKEQPRTKYVPRVTSKKKPKTSTSPLKQFKTSAEELKKEKQQPSTAKAPVKPVTKKAAKPKSTKDKTNHTNLLHLGKTTKPKKDNKPSLVMGEQLGTDQKSTTAPTPSKPKNTSSSSKKPKPSSDNSFFSI